MDSTETKYNFYKRAFRGGAQATQTPTQSETINLQPQTQPEQIQPQEQVQTQPEQIQPQEQTQTQDQTQAQGEPMATNGVNLQQLNQEIPKNKINFKVASMVGNLDQTLGPKQKINFDQLFMRQLFGSA